MALAAGDLGARLDRLDRARAVESQFRQLNVDRRTDDQTFVSRRLNPEETMVRVSTTCTEVLRGQHPGPKTPPFLAA
jgi:hypothetical protein